jgi:hypothetical protein
MPRTPKLPKSEAPLAPVPPEILDQFVRQGPLTPGELDAAVRRFKKAIIERALGGELTHHLTARGETRAPGSRSLPTGSAAWASKRYAASRLPGQRPGAGGHHGGLGPADQTC